MMAFGNARHDTVPGIRLRKLFACDVGPCRRHYHGLFGDVGGTDYRFKNKGGRGNKEHK